MTTSIRLGFSFVFFQSLIRSSSLSVCSLSVFCLPALSTATFTSYSLSLFSALLFWYSDCCLFSDNLFIYLILYSSLNSFPYIHLLYHRSPFLHHLSSVSLSLFRISLFIFVMPFVLFIAGVFCPIYSIYSSVLLPILFLCFRIVVVSPPAPRGWGEGVGGCP